MPLYGACAEGDAGEPGDGLARAEVEVPRDGVPGHGEVEVGQMVLEVLQHRARTVRAVAFDGEIAEVGRVHRLFPQLHGERQALAAQQSRLVLGVLGVASGRRARGIRLAEGEGRSPSRGDGNRVS